mmetsp:Transcript_39216/g.98546  ORF Transcript_39216/g.98546 Transcript_39216/m.98546 type:complete len:234 (+) Transcript_39216:145-846(+)
MGDNPTPPGLGGGMCPARELHHILGGPRGQREHELQLPLRLPQRMPQHGRLQQGCAQCSKVCLHQARRRQSAVCLCYVPLCRVAPAALRLGGRLPAQVLRALRVVKVLQQVRCGRDRHARERPQLRVQLLCAACGSRCQLQFKQLGRVQHRHVERLLGADLGHPPELIGAEALRKQQKIGTVLPQRRPHLLHARTHRTQKVAELHCAEVEARELILGDMRGGVQRHAAATQRR